MRRVLVTGATRGIGRTIAERLTEDGDRCIGTARNPSDERLSFPVLRADHGRVETAEEVISTAIESLEGLDAVVLNAGGVDDDLALALSVDRFRALVDVNLIGTYALARAALRHMVAQRRGRLIFISSTAAFTGGAGQVAYAAGKAGLTGLARSLALEGARRGVTANIVAPGLIDTDMTDALPTRVRQGVVERIPLGRPGTASEVAAAVAYLLSDEARYTTGSVLTVDGGLAMGV